MSPRAQIWGSVALIIAASFMLIYSIQLEGYRYDAQASVLSAIEVSSEAEVVDWKVQLGEQVIDEVDLVGGRR